MSEPVHWSTIAPADAIEIDVTKRDDIIGPLTQEGKECPWPWDPQQLEGAPLGMYHCGYCGEMVIAGMPHIDYREDLDGPVRQGEADGIGPREPAQGEGGGAEVPGQAGG